MDAKKPPQGVVIASDFTAMIRTLSDEEMAVYRAPFPDPISRLPTLVWPRQAPIEGEPEDVTEIVRAYGKWMSESPLPKLFISGEPGAVNTEGSPVREFCRTWPNQKEVTVKGRHFLQEDSPDDIGAAVRTFVTEIRAVSAQPQAVR